jgi:transposase
MLRIDFTAKDMADLDYERYHHPHPRVQRKMEVLYLKSQGLSHREIKRIGRISENTLLGYLRDYQAGGIERLKAIRYRCPHSALAEHHSTLAAYFAAHPPASVNEAMAQIEALTGLKRSPNRVRVFMKNLGLERRKVGSLPAKADVEAQERFKGQAWAPRVAEARAGKRAIFL